MRPGRRCYSVTTYLSLSLDYVSLSLSPTYLARSLARSLALSLPPTYLSLAYLSLSESRVLMNTTPRQRVRESSLIMRRARARVRKQQRDAA
jgi:hypothetical protein